MFGWFKKKNPASLMEMSSDAIGSVSTMEKAADPIDEKPGLEVKFSAGEWIPLKGIHFRIVRVDKAQLTLVPQSMTSKMAKRIEEAKR